MCKRSDGRISNQTPGEGRDGTTFDLRPNPTGNQHNTGELGSRLKQKSSVQTTLAKFFFLFFSFFKL